MIIDQRISVSAPVYEVWDLLWNQFGQVGDWASTVNQSADREAFGSVKGRTCTSTWGEVSEIVEKVDKEDMSYTYYADGLPSMMKKAKSTWKVKSTGENTTLITAHIEIEFAKIPGLLMGWMMKPKMRKDINQTFEDLRVYINTGKKTDAKIKSDLKFFKKSKKAA